MNELYIPYADISSVELHVLGSEENKRDAFVNVQHQDIYRGNLPYPQGTYALNMGTTDPELKCLTCQQYKKNCPGHPGVVNLKYPVVSPLFIKQIQKWLKCICFNCSKLIIENEKLDKIISGVRQDLILGVVAKAIKSMKTNKILRCYYCNAPHPNIKPSKTDNTSIEVTWNKDDRPQVERLYPHIIKNILDNILDSLVVKLGKPVISHPKKFILTALRAPPNTIRPDIKKISGGRTNNDDITVLLQNIVKMNQNIPDEIPDEITDDFQRDIDLLELHVYAMIKGTNNTSKRSLTNNSKKPLTSIAQRLPQKMGRIRRNLMGRRANYTARGFITCDPSLKIDEVGVPLKVARNLQVPVVIRDYNIDQANIWLMNKSKKYPGSTKLWKKSRNATHIIDIAQDRFRLEIGDIIYRDLINGDIVNFGRQPSLEPSSITSMKVRVIHEGDTIRMNVLQCPLFNADFDGDAMLLIVPRSSRTMNEIQMLAGPQQRFISYKNGRPVIGEAQDSLIGTAELTRKKTRMDKLHAMRMFNQTSIMPQLTKSSYSGREIITELLKENNVNINIKRKAKYYNESQAKFRDYDPEDINVHIENGVHKSGVLDKSTIGEGSNGGLFHIISNQYGPNTALKLSYEIQQIALSFLAIHGFTISIRDIIIKKKYMEEIHNVVRGLIADSILLTERLNEGKIVAPLGKTLEEYYEELQMQALNPGDSFWPPVLKSIDPEINNFDKLVMYGSKGSLDNFRSVSVAVGQSNLEGKRIPELFNRRALAYFPRYSSDPHARGYISNGIINGMGIAEFIFSSMPARQAYIRQSLSTSVSGSWNRYGIKNFDTLLIDNLRHVSKASKIIQPLYGGDGADPRRLEINKLPTMVQSDEDFRKTFKSTSKNPKTQKLMDQEFSQLEQDRDDFINHKLKKQAILSVPYSDSIEIPVNIYRILENTRSQTSNLDPEKAIQAVENFTKIISHVLVNEISEKTNREMPKHLQYATYMINIAIRSFLNVAELRRLKLDNSALDYVLTEIKNIYSRGLIYYGTAIGVIAAQSVSEPLTQLVIDSRHHATTGEKKKSMTRMKELLSATATAKMENPTMEIYTMPEYAYDKAKVQEIANQIETLPLKIFVENWKIFYEKYNVITHPDYKHEEKLIREYEKYNPSIKKPSDLVNWCIRIEMNREKLVEKQMPIQTIYTEIRKQFPETFIIYNSEGSKEMIMRIYLRNIQKQVINLDYLRKLIVKILNTSMRGVPGIHSCFVNETMNTVKENGNIINKKEYFISTSGTNLRGVFMLPWVDRYRTQTDSIEENVINFGIDAGRNKTISEYRNQVGDGVSIRHFMIYADEMSWTGVVTSVNRHGSAKRDSSFLLRISDSSPIGIIETTSVNGAQDKLNGFSAPLMVGRNPYIGDLYNNFVLDEEFINENTNNIDDILEDI